MKKCIWILAAAVLVTGVVQADEASKPKAAMDVRASIGQGGSTAATGVCVDFPICTGFEADCSLGGAGDDGWVVGWMCDPFTNGTEASCLAAGPRPDPGIDPNNECPGDNCCVDDPNSNSGWYLSASSQNCEQPRIDTVNPYSGDQHMRFSTEPILGCFDFTGACRVTAFSPIEDPSTAVLGPVTVRAMVQGSAFGAATLDFWTQTETQGLRTTVLRLDWYGTVWVQGDSGYFSTGVPWVPGVYKEMRVEVNPCDGEYWVKHYYDNVMVWQEPIWAGSLVEAFFFMTDNKNTDFDIDDLQVIRGGKCPNECGNGIVEAGEECETNDICGLGYCIPPNGGKCVAGFCDAGINMGLACVNDMDCDDPDDCFCVRACDEPGFDAECELDNGLQTFRTFGGWGWYVADTPFTHFDLCGSTGNDTFLMMGWYRVYDGMIYSFMSYNDDCAFWDPYGQVDPLSSCYYPYISFEWYESCLCMWTTPGDVYFVQTDYFGEVPPGHTTNIFIEKRMGCDGEYFPGGACCFPAEGSCVDFYPDEQTCLDDGGYRWVAEKLCDYLDEPCEPQPGGCCNHHIGGGCVDEVMYANCQGDMDEWDYPDCSVITCDVWTGACCDRAPGLFGNCTDDVLPEDCTGQWQTHYLDEWCGELVPPCSEARGACCDSAAGPLAQQGICTDDLLLSECQCDKCAWSKGETCAGIECEANFVDVPTVSEWGLVILTLLLLAGAKVYFSRREATA